jgi:phenylpropionate dioxygenase-like ring-hydroxylating dioxygenase large terminal subunit
MRATRQMLLRRFPYPVMPLTRFAETTPASFCLLGQELVLWSLPDGGVGALHDRCPHCSARLSVGRVVDERIACALCGERFDRTGRADAGHAAQPVHVAARYDYAWVALDAPLQPIPDLPEHDDPGMRCIPQFYEPWRTAGLRLMENSFDNAHFSFVHRNTFGPADPIPADLKITDTDYGLRMTSTAPVNNPAQQQQLLGIQADRTVRHMTSDWFLPFGRKLRIRYPNGLIHAIVTWATPIDDAHSMVCQWAYRSDSEGEAPAAEVNAFDRAVTLEDRTVLESTDPDVPLDHRSGEEMHMPSDEPGIVMRKRLHALLAAHGEAEARRAVA